MQSAADFDKTIAPGETAFLAGRYRVLRKLGGGGMGEVFLAEDTKLDNLKVALKMLPAVLVSSERAKMQLKAEALAQRKLVHPNIVAMRDFEDDGVAAFLVMDYVEGVSLDKILLERGRLGEAETVKILSGAAAALDFAHERKIIHRDVKPANIMVDREGRAMVLDFGISCEMRDTMTRTTGEFKSGTILYMSPEQLEGRRPAPAQDVYSLAATAYECLAGRPPFSSGKIDYQIVNTAPEKLDDGISIADAVMAGLSKDPALRPAACAALFAPRAKRETHDTAHATQNPGEASLIETAFKDAKSVIVQDGGKSLENAMISFGVKSRKFTKIETVSHRRETAEELDGLLKKNLAKYIASFSHALGWKDVVHRIPPDAFAQVGILRCSTPEKSTLGKYMRSRLFSRTRKAIKQSGTLAVVLAFYIDLLLLIPCLYISLLSYKSGGEYFTSNAKLLDTIKSCAASAVDSALEEAIGSRRV